MCVLPGCTFHGTSKSEVSAPLDLYFWPETPWAPSPVCLWLCRGVCVLGTGCMKFPMLKSSQRHPSNNTFKCGCFGEFAMCACFLHLGAPASHVTRVSTRVWVHVWAHVCERVSVSMCVSACVLSPSQQHLSMASVSRVSVRCNALRAWGPGWDRGCRCFAHLVVHLDVQVPSERSLGKRQAGRHQAASAFLLCQNTM